MAAELARKPRRVVDKDGDKDGAGIIILRVETRSALRRDGLKISPPPRIVAVRLPPVLSGVAEDCSKLLYAPAAPSAVASSRDPAVSAANKLILLDFWLDDRQPIRPRPAASQS